MSQSDTPAARLDAVAAELRALAGADLPPEALRGAIGAATLLYAAAVRRMGHEIALADPEVSPTDAVVLCCALLRGQDLNPFDLSLWFGRVTPDPRA
ncbi:hypothetical protein [Muricoccus radiodurans]|uniref:hypothetical protein n=1 Tax=Muricoccus radiodurans TaxID=2231721 RepID=UPI003CEFB41A